MAFFHACISSLDIEISLSIFNCGVAGNVENFDILGSMEFARKRSGGKVILVKTHAVLRLAGLRAGAPLSARRAPVCPHRAKTPQRVAPRGPEVHESIKGSPCEPSFNAKRAAV